MRRDWRDDALCREVSLDLFFPGKGDPVQPAKRICRNCEVRQDCLDDALSFPAREDQGIRGGLSERERRRLRKAPPAPLLPLPVVPTRDVPERRAA